MPFCTQRRIEFRDTDAAGIVHFSAFFPFLESAEHELLRSLGLSVMQPLDDGGHLTWPRVAATCDYTGTAKFEDLLSIEVAVEHLGTKSVRYGFTIRRDASPIATATLTAVCCRLTADGQLTSIPIPDDVRQRLESVASG
ncbi:acyl-CoA thioesterase [Candidatus Laterigemmans baculatus]|uniref:acyl-CoA thioesterase n=1 Tax=Candidatus Laterigemmans baculatus TaxID=2770505 RepID=UPI001F228C42|nr:thioesterase family protein [Candidatus Laterigemmans baculatus]